MRRNQVDEALQGAVAKVRGNARRFGDRFPPDVTTSFDYSPGLGGNVGWTTGFWVGMLWLAYQVTGDRELADRASVLGSTFDSRLAAKVGIDHDLGMLLLPSRVLEYRLTGNPEGREAGLKGAHLLAERFREPGGYIQAWGALDDPREAGRTIVDSMMNLPLLFWAHREAGVEAFRERAVRHAGTVRRYLVRGDGSTYHTFFFDVATGQPVGGRTHQGHADGSTWARGQAWALYGFTIAYRLTGELLFRDCAERVAAYFLSRLPDDGVCYWDLDVSGADQPRDTSAAAIAACGLLELAQRPGDPRAREYEEAAGAIVRQLMERYQAPADREALLVQAVADLPRGRGIGEAALYGDYFYLECLVRLSGRRAVLPWLF